MNHYYHATLTENDRTWQKHPRDKKKKSSHIACKAIKGFYWT